MNSNKFSLKARLTSFRHAFNGLWSLFKNEHNSRIHSLMTVLAITTGLVLKINLIEWCLVTIVIGMVFIAEIFNTSLETLADIDPEWNEGIKKAKDYAASAVLISAIISGIVGGLIFIPKILDFLRKSL